MPPGTLFQPNCVKPLGMESFLPEKMVPFSEAMMVSAADHVVDVPDHLKVTTDDDQDGSPPQAAVDNFGEVEDLCLRLTRDAKAQYENVEKMVKQRNSDSLRDFGGSKGIADALHTDVETGLPEEEILYRCFGASNSFSQVPHKQLTEIVLKSCNDCTVLLLLFYAALVGGFGMRMKGPRTGWYESLVIFISIVVLVAVRSAHEFWKLRKQREMEKKKDENIKVRVVRGGVETKLSISELVPGDVVLLKRGDLIPADGLFVSGRFLALDDEQLLVDEERNPFLFFGGKVINGHGRMLVVSVGGEAEFRELRREVMSTTTTSDTVSPFEHQLNRVIKVTQILGTSMCILLLIVLFLHFTITKHKSRLGTPNLKDKPTSIEALLKILKRFIGGPKEKISVLTILALSMLGTAEGLPFFIALAIIYWNKKLFVDASIRDLSASVTMGSVNTICIDKTGLALNPWHVDRSFVGDEAINDDTEVASNVLGCIAEGIMATQIAKSSAEEDPVFIFWAESKFSLDMEKVKQGFTFLMAKELEWSDGGSAALIEKKEADNVGQPHQIWHYRAGAREILEKSSHFYDTSNGERKHLDEQKRGYFEKSIDEMESDGLKIIGFANKRDEDEKDLEIVGFLGLKKMCCKQTKEAIKECKNGGIKIVLLTQDSLSQAEEIALRHGIITENSIDHQLVIDAEKFRDFNSEQRMGIVDKICVLANCLPQDKLLLLRSLKEKKQITAMVIFNANNIPAVREADVGIALDTHSTSLAKENADIIIKGCYFSCLVTIISYGGGIFFNTQKQIQSEITTLASGMLISLVASAISSYSPISGIQFAWIYFLVAIVAGVGHLTDSSGGKLTKQTPGKRRVSLLTKGMIMNIALHLTYQVAVLLTVRFKIQKEMGMNGAGKTFISNSFFFCQIFNVLAREMEKMTTLKDIIHKQKLLWLAVIAATILQAMFIKVSVVSSSPPLSCSEWMVCLLIGLVPFLIDCSGMFVKRKLKDSRATHSNLETPLIR